MTFITNQQIAAPASATSGLAKALAKGRAAVWGMFNRQPSRDIYANPHFDKIARAQRDMDKFWKGMH